VAAPLPESRIARLVDELPSNLAFALLFAVASYYWLDSRCVNAESKR
jgi:hypothetical protein